MKREDVYKLIDGERDYQDVRWQDDHAPNGVHTHSYTEWLVYLDDYLKEAMHIASRKPDPEANVAISHIMRKVAAMAVAAMEQNGASPRQ